MTFEQLGALRDVIYQIDSPDSRWLEDLALSYHAMMPDATQVVTVDLRFDAGRCTLAGMGTTGSTPRALVSLCTRAMPAEANRRIMRQASTVGSMSEWLGVNAMPGHLSMFASMGVSMKDFVAIHALDGGNRMLGLAAWYPEQRQTSAAFRRRLEPLAAHLATMFRLRRALGAQKLQLRHGAALLEVDGRLAHANDETSGVRDTLRKTVQRAERARTRGGTRDGTLWSPLVDGRWSLIDRFDTDGRRYYVAVENAPQFAKSHALSTREQQVSRMAAQGLANKEIAYALGLEDSSVATYLRRALEKLRLRDRGELPHILEESASTIQISGQGVHISADSLHAHPTLTKSEQTVAEMAARGRRDREIAGARGSSPRTVANLLRAAYRKLGVTNRTELVRALRKPFDAGRERVQNISDDVNNEP